MLNDANSVQEQYRYYPVKGCVLKLVTRQPPVKVTLLFAGCTKTLPVLGQQYPTNGQLTKFYYLTAN